jgi:cytoskeletal protein CcmA (bactofilin family)
VIYNGDLVVTGNLTVDGDIIEAGNIITDSKLLQLSNAAVTANAANGSGVVVGANANIATFLFDSATNTWDTNIGLAVSGAGNFAGNVAANYFIGNGSQLTGINASSNSIFNGTSNVNIATANANVTVGVDGLSNVAVFGPGSLTVNGWIGNPRVVANDIIIPPGINASMVGPLAIGNSITGFVPDDSAFYVLGHDPVNIE